MDSGAGCNIPSRGAVFLDGAQANARGRGIAFNRSIGCDSRDPGIADRRDKAMMCPRLLQATGLDFTMRQLMRVDDLSITAFVEIDDHFAIVVDDVKRPWAGQGLPDGIWVFDFNV